MSESASELGGGSPRPAAPDGAERAEAVIAPLERLAGLPVGDHVAVFEEVFDGLETILASVGGTGGDPAGEPEESHHR